jgi:hypothetical protein
MDDSGFGFEVRAFVEDFDPDWGVCGEWRGSLDVAAVQAEFSYASYGRLAG